jgi:branched-chain amino acid aminotransferase
MWVQLNDKLVAAEEACVSVFDRGFMYGDGVFETMRAYVRRVFRLDAHLQRLTQSATSLKIKVPFSPEQIASHIESVLRANEHDDAVVRVTVTRGAGERGTAIDLNRQPTYVVSSDPLPAGLEERGRNGISLAVVGVRRVPVEALPAHAKHSNYLNSILANTEAVETGADEALMLSMSGHLAECSTGNIFLVKGSDILTPSLTTGILPGITRAVVLELTNVKEMLLPRDAVFEADEVFMTNSVVGILPVRRVDSHDFPVRGPLTSGLIRLYRELILRSLL